MKKITCFIKQIHSCNASASSRDNWVFIEVENYDHNIEETQKHGLEFFELLQAVRTHGRSIMEEKPLPDSYIKMPGHVLDGEIVTEVLADEEFPQYRKVYVQPDKTFNNGDFFEEFHDTEEYKALLQSYLDKGWKLLDREGRTKEHRKFNKFLEDKELYQRSEAELVLWNYGKEGFNVEQYNGGFSKEVHEHPEFQQYVNSGCVYGWLGNAGTRTRFLDRKLERELMQNKPLPLDAFVGWLTSTDGRRFCESLHEKSETEQRNIIRRRSVKTYNIALIYADPRHQRTDTSTEEVRALLRKEGKLMEEATC